MNYWCTLVWQHYLNTFISLLFFFQQLSIPTSREHECFDSSIWGGRALSSFGDNLCGLSRWLISLLTSMLSGWLWSVVHLISGNRKQPPPPCSCWRRWLSQEEPKGSRAAKRSVVAKDPGPTDECWRTALLIEARWGCFLEGCGCCSMTSADRRRGTTLPKAAVAGRFWCSCICWWCGWRSPPPTSIFVPSNVRCRVFNRCFCGLGVGLLLQ